MPYDLDRAREMDEVLGSDDEEVDDVLLRAAFKKLVTEIGDVDPQELEDDVGLMERTFRTLRAHEELEGELREIRRRLDEHETVIDRLDDIGNGLSTKEQKIAQVVAYARNSRGPDQTRVTVTRQNVKGATGISRRYSYRLIDDMITGDGDQGAVGPNGFDWALDPQDQPRHVEQDVPDVGVLIDFERLHDDPAAVNKFITRNGEEGAES
jgi:hypothetical protein